MHKSRGALILESLALLHQTLRETSRRLDEIETATDNAYGPENQADRLLDDAGRALARLTKLVLPGGPDA